MKLAYADPAYPHQWTVGSLFSGIGGLDLGLERAGWQVIWQAETDPYASQVLKKHWPDVPNLGDVTDVGRVAHGVPARVDRLRCLGNAVVPQVAELVARMWLP